MRKIILSFGMVILSFFNFSAFGQGGWFLQNNPTNTRGVSTKFVSATEGWINLSSNALLHTTNGGANWNVVVPNATDITVGFDASGQTMSFINSSTGWVLKTLSNSNEDALGAVVYKTINGGATWNRTVLSSTIGDVAVQLQFVDANHGWALVYNMGTGTPTFLKTTDGGTTWTTTNGGGIFYYVNATIGYAFAAGPNMLPPYTIYKTTDGGTNWTPQWVDTTAGELSAIQFTDANNGWIVGRNGKIFKTTNGGVNWSALVYNSNYRNNDVFFINSNVGWIASDPQGSNPVMLHTTNGGLSWTEESLPFNSKVCSMYFWDANNGWATSDSYNQGGNDYPGQIAKYLYNPAGTYTNATLNGPWFAYTDLTPIEPLNDNLLYVVFNGNGLVTDLSGFGSPWFGNYSVNSSGVIFGNITNGIENFTISGLLTSTTEGTAQVVGQNWRLHKVTNPGALKDKITGTLTTDGCGSRNVTINIDNNGIITSASGLTGPVIGRVYADLGVYVGHMTTGEGVHWNELTITGYYSNNNLVGQMALDDDSQNPECTNGISNLVRSDNLGIIDVVNDKKITIYPNPNNGTFNLNLPNIGSDFQIEIYDAIGHKIYSSSQTSSEIIFNTKSKGMYFIKVNDGKAVYKGKVIIE